MQIEIFSDISKTNKIFYNTNIVKNIKEPEWNLSFKVNLENLKDFDNETSFFTLKLLFKEKNKEKKEENFNFGQEYKFSFSELINQEIHEKIVRIKEKNSKNISGKIFFRCQFIHNFKKFLEFWKNEIEIQNEVIKRIIKKIEQVENIEINTKNAKEFKGNSLFFNNNSLISNDESLNASLLNDQIKYFIK